MITSTNGRHTTGTSPGNGNAHATLTATIPIVQFSPPDGPESSVMNGVSPIPDRDPAPEAEAVPGGESEGESEQEPVQGAPLSLHDWYVRHRERMPTRRSDWPVEAERPSERLRYNQAIAVGLLISGMTQTDVAKQLGVHRTTVHRWMTKDPFFIAELEARRSDLLDSMLDLQVLGGRIGTQKLLELVESTNESVALRAAVPLMNASHKAYQFIDEKKRIERLEDNMAIVGGIKR